MKDSQNRKDNYADRSLWPNMNIHKSCIIHWGDKNLNKFFQKGKIPYEEASWELVKGVCFSKRSQNFGPKVT